MRGTYDAFNLGDSRVGVPLDPIPVFMTMRLDRALLRPVNAMGGGKGTVQYRRALDTTVFVGPWAYVDHLLIPPGSSTGPQLHREVAEFYYVMSGQGNVTVLHREQPRRPYPSARAMRFPSSSLTCTLLRTRAANRWNS